MVNVVILINEKEQQDMLKCFLTEKACIGASTVKMVIKNEESSLFPEKLPMNTIYFK